MPRNPRSRAIQIRGAAAVHAAAAATVEDVRRAYYESGVPPTYWITELQVDPPQLIVSDDATSNLYRVPVQLDGSSVTFGAPVQVEAVITDMPAPAKTAASRGVPRGAEARIAAAIADGKIPRSRAAHYRALAAAGDDLSVLDTLAGTPGLVLAGGAQEDAEDALYRSLFGGGPAGAPQAASGVQAGEDAAYGRLFGRPGRSRTRPATPPCTRRWSRTGPPLISASPLRRRPRPR